MEAAPPRSTRQRREDTLHRLGTDVDAWVSSADERAEAYLAPLSFLWDGQTLTFATPADGTTGRNLRRAGRVRLALGTTRDVVLVHGTVRVVDRDDVPDELAETFAARHWDARRSEPPYAYFLVTPVRIQAWREENELAGRTIMRDGRWLDD